MAGKGLASSMGNVKLGLRLVTVKTPLFRPAGCVQPQTMLITSSDRRLVMMHGFGSWPESGDNVTSAGVETSTFHDLRPVFGAETPDVTRLHLVEVGVSCEGFVMSTFLGVIGWNLRPLLNGLHA